jgi:hypothetical protein
VPIKEAHPDAVKLDEAFAAAMDTPGKPREPGPPPEIDADAPHGRDNDDVPLAPYGYTKDGKVRRSAAGRKPAEDKARVTDAPPVGAEQPKGKDKQPAAAGGYAPAIADTLETIWLGGAVLGTAGPDLPVVGKLIPGVQLQAQAAVVLTYKDNLAGALDLCAQHNAAALRLAERCQSGDIGWALNAAFMVFPFVSTSLQVWGKQEREKHPETGEPLPTLNEQLAAQTDKALKDYMAKLAEAAAAAQEQAPADDQPPAA